MIDGWPIAHPVFAGNPRDATTVKQDLPARFGLRRVVFVGDRGMVTAQNIELLRARKSSDVVGLNRKAPLGPVPTMFSRLEEGMIRDRHISVVTRRVYVHFSQRLFPLTEPTFNFLSAWDIAVVTEWIRHFWGWTAKRVSDYSHGHE